MGKRSLTRRLVVGLFREQDGICYLCGGAMSLARLRMNSATLDHVVPKCQLKKPWHDLALTHNHKAACMWCNNLKGSMTLESFRLHFPRHKWPGDGSWQVMNMLAAAKPSAAPALPVEGE
jgi:5-methylcytosine-specific restriction endonuclease McrA